MLEISANKTFSTHLPRHSSNPFFPVPRKVQGFGSQKLQSKGLVLCLGKFLRVHLRVGLVLCKAKQRAVYHRLTW